MDAPKSLFGYDDRGPNEIDAAELARLKAYLEASRRVILSDLIKTCTYEFEGETYIKPVEEFLEVECDYLARAGLLVKIGFLLYQVKDRP